jgi:hypothetical protein
MLRFWFLSIKNYSLSRADVLWFPEVPHSFVANIWIVHFAPRVTGTPPKVSSVYHIFQIQNCIQFADFTNFDHQNYQNWSPSVV